MLVFLWIIILYSVGYASSQLEFIADFTTPQNSIFDKTLIGGLSGIYFKDNFLWAVSDDRGQNNEPRIYSFKLIENSLANRPEILGHMNTLNSRGITKFRVDPYQVLSLKSMVQTTNKQLQIDAESLVPFDKGWLVSSEGNYHIIPRKIPSLMYFDSQGKFIREINWPDKFIPNTTGKQKKGLRNNYAFEGLSISPDQTFFFAIHEAPLVQDKTNWSAGEEGEVHLLRFKITSSGKMEVDKDIIYKIDAYKGSAGKILGSGVSEILSITNDKLLILERNVVLNSIDPLRYEVKVYEVSILKPNEKKLVIDLNNIKKLLKTTKELDNFEGMALGPIVNNQLTLLMVSDDNFSPLENTIWLLFKLNLEP